MRPMTPPRPSAADGGCLPGFLLFVSMVPLSIIHGAVLMKLWEWFVADPFGVREVGLPLAIGLSAIASALTVSAPRDDDMTPWEALVKVWIFRLTASALFLVEGLIVSRWV